LGITPQRGSYNITYEAVDHVDHDDNNSLEKVDESITNDGIDPQTTPSVVWQNLSSSFSYVDFLVLQEGTGNGGRFFDLARGKGQIMYSDRLFAAMNNTLDRLKIEYIFRGQHTTYISDDPEDLFTNNAVPDRLVSQQMAILFPENIRYVAGLYQLFWERTHTIYVNLNFTGNDSDGSLQRPFRTITSAYQAAPNGSTIRIFRGSYPELLTMNKRLRLEIIDGVVSIGGR